MQPIPVFDHPCGEKYFSLYLIRMSHVPTLAPVASCPVIVHLYKSLALAFLYPCKNLFRTVVEPLLSSVFLAFNRV